jgi:hypothetical protein
MSYSVRKEQVRLVESAKSEPTRQRRVAKAVADLARQASG